MTGSKFVSLMLLVALFFGCMPAEVQGRFYRNFNFFNRKKKARSCRSGYNGRYCMPEVEIDYDNEKIYLVNVGIISMDDIQDLFSIQRNWLMNYFRDGDQQRRLRGRDLQERRRDSRDITTSFRFTSQNVTRDKTTGKPTNEISYRQTISFLPPGTRRELVEVDIDNPQEVYQVATTPYRDAAAMQRLTTRLKNQVGALSDMDGLYKLFDPIRVFVQSELTLNDCANGACPTQSQLPMASSPP